MKRAPMTFNTPAIRVAVGDRDYPRALLDLDEPPRFLRVAGRIGECPALRVGIVGTRHTDPDALAFATELAADLGSQGVTVISGGARGIDTAAHRGALSVGAPTVCVLATGLVDAYPPENAALFGEIADSGAVVTEADDAWAPKRGLFLRRNRIIAALSEVLVVVQAPARSGALSTARVALQLRRPVYAVPDAPWRARSAGCLWLLSAGARICTSARDILSHRPAGRRTTPGRAVGKGKTNNDYSHLHGLGQRVLELIEHGPLGAGQIGSQLDIPINHVQEVLLSLELSGRVARRFDGTYAPTA